MNVTAEIYGHAVILNCKGELTEDTLGALQQAVDHQLKGKEVVDIVLNLEHVPFIDSVCLEYLLDLQDRLAERLGQVRLAKPDENVRKVLEIVRLAASFETFKDLPEAVQVVQP